MAAWVSLQSVFLSTPFNKLAMLFEYKFSGLEKVIYIVK